MAKSVYRRRLSVVDIQYAALGSRITDSNQIILQHVVEGTGHIDNELVKDCVKQLARAVPSCHLLLKGRWGFKEWRAEGPLPTVKTIYQEWDGHYQPDTGFLDQPLDLFHGPVSEIIQVVSKDRTFIVFRAHHAVMDGVAMQSFIHNFFRILREEPAENQHSELTVEDLQTWDVTTQPREMIQKAITPLGEKQQSINGNPTRTWQRISTNANDMLVLSKVMVAMSELAREQQQGNVRINAPVDLRRYLPSQEKTGANFVGNIIVDIEEGDTLKIVTKKFNRQYAAISKDIDGAQKLSKVLRWVPFTLVKQLAKRISKQHHQKTHFGFSGTVSTIGYVKLREYSTEHFTAHSFFGIPISQLLTPVFVSVISTEQGSELVLGAPANMASDNRLANMAEKLQQKLN